MYGEKGIGLGAPLPLLLGKPMLLFLCVLQLLHGAQLTYYMSPNGTDSNPGTASLPVRSFSRIKALVAGLTLSDSVQVNLASGTYVEPSSTTHDFSNTVMSFTGQGTQTVVYMNGFSLIFGAVTMTNIYFDGLQAPGPVDTVPSTLPPPAFITTSGVGTFSGVTMTRHTACGIYGNNNCVLTLDHFDCNSGLRCLHTLDCNITVVNSKISKNQDLTTYGVLNFETTNQFRSAVLRRSTFSFNVNKATVSKRSALVFAGGSVNTVQLQIMDCLFSDNMGPGGILLAFNAISDISDSVVQNNICEAAGGMMLRDGRHQVENVTFINNTASSLPGAGALYLSPRFTSHQSTLKDCRFKNNRAINGRGGAVMAFGSSASTASTTFINCLFEGNLGVNGAGAFYDYAVTVTMVDTTFQSNNIQVLGSGGGTIYVEAAPANFQGTVFADDALDATGIITSYDAPITIAGATFRSKNPVVIEHQKNLLDVSDTNFGASGGLFFGSEVYIAHSQFYGGFVRFSNQASGDLDLCEFVGGSGAVQVRDSDTRVTISNSLFENNTNSQSLDFGSGALSVTAGGHCTVNKTTFRFNIGITGGGIGVTQGSLDVTDSHFISNVARDYVSSGGFVTTGSGGGIYARSATVSVATSDFLSNKAVLGGASYYEDVRRLVIEQSNFWFNSATQSTATSTCALSSALGGALYLTSSTTASIDQSTFGNNTADVGGAVYVRSSAAVIEKSTLTGNIATQGGAIASVKAQVNTTKSNFSGNEARRGLVIYSDSARSVTSMEALGFTQNTYDSAFSAIVSGPPVDLKLLVPERLLNYTSGTLFAPLEVSAIDGFGLHVATFPDYDIPGVTVFVEMIVVPSGLPLIGAPVKTVHLGTANFSDFGLFMLPGSNATLRFQMYSAPFGNIQSSAVYQITSRMCRGGEYLSRFVCLPCPPGTYSSRNNSEKCEVCGARRKPSIAQNSCICLDGKLPPCMAKVDPDGWARYIIYALAAVVMMVIVGCMVIVWIFRRNRVIYYASPLFCMIILVGSLCSAVSALLGVVSLQPQVCTVKVWLLPIGFSLGFGALFARTYRLYKVFNNPKLRVKAIKNYQLFGMVMSLVVLDVAVLAAWTAVSPYKYFSKEELYCHSPKGNIFAGVLMCQKGVLAAGGAVLAYVSRTLPSTYNETNLIAIAIYTLALLGVLTVLITYAFSLSVSTWIPVQSFLILVNTLVTVVTIFFPKFYKIYKKEDGMSYLDEWKRQQNSQINSGTSNGREASQPRTTKLNTNNIDPKDVPVVSVDPTAEPERQKKDARLKWEERLKQVENSIDTLTTEIYKLAAVVDQSKKKFEAKKETLRKAEALRAFIYQELDLLDEGGWTAQDYSVSEYRGSKQREDSTSRNNREGNAANGDGTHKGKSAASLEMQDIPPPPAYGSR